MSKSSNIDTRKFLLAQIENSSKSNKHSLSRPDSTLAQLVTDLKRWNFEALLMSFRGLETAGSVDFGGASAMQIVAEHSACVLRRGLLFLQNFAYFYRGAVGVRSLVASTHGQRNRHQQSTPSCKSGCSTSRCGLYAIA
jgi:hypothetical protein